ncbi:MAG: winged helix-turn-helix domain-containing protein [Thermofilaceae archaeon]
MKIETVYRILKLLEENGPMSISRIAKHLGISRKTASLYVYWMEARGLVELREHGKALIVTPSPASRPLLHVISMLQPETRWVWWKS